MKMFFLIVKEFFSTILSNWFNLDEMAIKGILGVPEFESAVKLGKHQVWSLCAPFLQKIWAQLKNGSFIQIDYCGRYPKSRYLCHQYGPSLLTTNRRANTQAQQGDG